MFFLNAATADVANSGRKVPAATIVKLINFSLVPSIWAMIMALSTTILLPVTSDARLITIRRIVTPGL